MNVYLKCYTCTRCNKRHYAYSSIFIIHWEYASNLEFVKIIDKRDVPYKQYKGKEVHHIDMNNKNNSEENLIVLDKEDHIKVHRNMNKILRSIARKYIQERKIRFNKIQKRYYYEEKEDKFLN